MIAKQDKLTGIFSSVEANKALMLKDLSTALFNSQSPADLKKTERELNKSGLLHPLIETSALTDEHGRPAKQLIINSALDEARKKRHLTVFSSLVEIDETPFLFYKVYIF